MRLLSGLAVLVQLWQGYKGRSSRLEGKGKAADPRCGKCGHRLPTSGTCGHCSGKGKARK